MSVVNRTKRKQKYKGEVLKLCGVVKVATITAAADKNGTEQY